LVGVIQTANGNLDILVERVDRGKAGKVWLFSRETLASIPDAFQEVSESALERFLLGFMVTTRVADIPLFELVALFVGMPFLYWLTGLLNRILSVAAGALRRSYVEMPTWRIRKSFSRRFAFCFLPSLSGG
jgi:hypothetical protein